MMCHYCGDLLSDEGLTVLADNVPVRFCDDCAVIYYQEQQEKHFQSWVKYR